DLVEVELEDLLLRVSARDLDREDRLADLALQADLAADDALLHELLRDRRGTTLAAVAVRHVRDGGANDPEQVHAGIGPERFVLGGDRRIADDLRDVAGGHEIAVLVRG